MLVTGQFLFLASGSSIMVHLHNCETRSSHFSFLLHTINAEDKRTSELFSTGKKVIIFTDDLMHLLAFINISEWLRGCVTLVCLCCTRPIFSTSPTTMNASQEFLYRDSHQENVLLSIFYALVFVIAVPGNTLALWTFAHQDSMSPSDVFLRHLSVADISYVLVLPVRMGYHLSDNHWHFGEVACRLAGFLFYLNMYCSLYLMSFISVDRSLAVVFAIRAQSVRKTLYAKVGVGILWVTVIVSMSPTLFLNRGLHANSSDVCSKLYLEETSLTSLVSTVVAFVVPFTTILLSYVLILWKLRTVKQRHVKEKAMKMAILIPMNFLLAFLPYHVCRLVYIVHHNSSLVRGPLAAANRLTSALTCVSGVLDPVMYFFLNRAYREKLLLTCKMGTLCPK